MLWVRQQQPNTSQGHNLYQTQNSAPQHGTQYGMPLTQAAAMATAAAASGSSHPYGTSSYPSLPQSSPRMATVNATSARSSQKRPRVEEDNDSDDENSTRRPKPKTLKRDNSDGHYSRINTLFEEWLSNHASSSRSSASSGYPPSSSRPQRNNGPSQLMGNQATPSSFAESGVEIRSQVPSSRSREDASFSSYAHMRPVPQSEEVLNKWQSGTEDFNVDDAASHFQNIDQNLLQTFSGSFPHATASQGHLAQDDGGHFDAGSFDHGFNHVQSNDIDELLSGILEDAQPMERPDYQERGISLSAIVALPYIHLIGEPEQYPPRFHQFSVSIVKSLFGTLEFT
ncbi:hypothetical protein DL766_002468 [Monosporascus sp. MC13-8B]|uniref:Transcription factor domain-containing protein n=1 Tax=Monosporascus cannonballus TaxID=155416 RepID=A0ABY0HCB4_9PEZI|nr:hypothetical protein DL762_002859 [Monosporascus cannonballus]RYO95596.1 hypothetical protein DL763_003666 [Monosporascus cannonballus]RYP35457.1 hypothetical protein DL766_002468 [Monosporascus sp. MC13-8B]